ncbi:unnamed protein product [Adineta ricciae]|uniref:Bromo domain-containing protein n=1 Tax=Adineta ricciae TaxID=249248 RepID=A0A814TJB5_ADIRI|nr:unnamed protein product [Adineta ricciae]CAF1160869.1 unnamed protein product [Adineta ricciae]
MTAHIWDLKSNYMLAFTVCKYASHFEAWNSIANDLADYINTTPQDCQMQFDCLYQQYGHDWNQQSSESLQSYIFTIIKRLYYGDLCNRMTESRDLLMVTYDFIRLFKIGRITSKDINDILQDIKNTAPSGDSFHDDERELKIKMLGRLKSYMTKQNDLPTDLRNSSFPVELLPPPPFFQTQVNFIPQTQTISPPNANDRQVPSLDAHPKLNPPELSSFPIIIQSNNLLIENDRPFIAKNQTTTVHIEEIELSSDDDTNEQPVRADIGQDQEESTLISDELTDTNQSANALPITSETSNSNEQDFYEHVSDTSLSNQSTVDTCLSAQEQLTNGEQRQLSNSNLNGDGSATSYHSSVQNHSQHLIRNEMTPAISERDRADNDLVQMDETPVSNGNILKSSSNYIDNYMTSSHSEMQETNDLTTSRNSRRQARVMPTLTKNHNRKSINAVLSCLKSAKYGYDFAQSLDSFKLSDEYYTQIKNPLDIPEIRERLNNGDYDDDMLLFQRDILMMFTNALYAYERDLDIHKHAQYMIKYSMELFTSMEDALTPWAYDENNHNPSSKNLRRHTIVTHSTTTKRQRKTTN